MARGNGHNGSPEKSYFERAVRLENEKADLVNDLKALWEEAKRDADLDAQSLKALKRAVRIHVEDPECRQRREQTELDAKELLARLGVLADLPLGRAALGERVDPVHKEFMVDDTPQPRMSISQLQRKKEPLRNAIFKEDIPE